VNHGVQTDFTPGVVVGGMALSFIVCCAVIWVALRIAVRVGLVDRPSSRKKHAGDVPLVGGIAIYITAVLGFAITGQSLSTTYLLLGALPLVLLGVMDDLVEINNRIKLAVQIVVTLAVVHYSGVVLLDLGNLLGNGELVFGTTFGTLFTVFCVIGVVNAVNMSDGVDGVAGALACTTLLVLAGFSASVGDSTVFGVAILFAGTLVAYLFFNLGLCGRQNKVFLGDAGSMLIGLVMALLLVRLTQGQFRAFSPAVAGWLLGVPLLDTVAVILRRTLRGVSPFTAGRDHFHHKLLDAGFSSRSTLLILFSIHACMLCVGIVAHFQDTSAALLFWAFVILTLVHMLGIRRLSRLRPDWVVG